MRPGGPSTSEADNAILICHALTGRRPRHRRWTAAPTRRRAGGLESSGPDAASTPNDGSSCAQTSIGVARGARARHRSIPQRAALRFELSRRSRIATSCGRQAMPRRSPRNRAWFSVIGGSMGGMTVSNGRPCTPIGFVRSLRSRRRWPPARNRSHGRRWDVWRSPTIGGSTTATTTTGRQDRATGWPLPARSPHPLSKRRRVRRAFRPRSDRSARPFDWWGRFQIEGYLDHHGKKFPHRFDANSISSSIGRWTSMTSDGAGRLDEGDGRVSRAGDDRFGYERFPLSRPTSRPRSRRF